jgi:hypothetical protein
VTGGLRKKKTTQTELDAIIARLSAGRAGDGPGILLHHEDGTETVVAVEARVKSPPTSKPTAPVFHDLVPEENDRRWTVLQEAPPSIPDDKLRRTTKMSVAEEEAPVTSGSATTPALITSAITLARDLGKRG